MGYNLPFRPETSISETFVGAIRRVFSDNLKEERLLFKAREIAEIVAGVCGVILSTIVVVAIVVVIVIVVARGPIGPKYQFWVLID